MTSTTTHTIVGFFPTRQEAETAVSELVRDGFSRDRISIVASHRPAGTRAGDTPNIGPIEETGSLEDTGEKAAIGGMAGFIIGIAALAIPGVGPLIAAGPLAAALTGAAAGAATGGLIGVMTKDGVPEAEARRYTKAISSGRVMVSVYSEPERVDLAAGILDRCGAIDVDEPAEHVSSGSTVTQTGSAIGTSGTSATTPHFDESSGVRARQKERERRVDVYPGITGGGITS